MSLPWADPTPIDPVFLSSDQQLAEKLPCSPRGGGACPSSGSSSDPAPQLGCNSSSSRPGVEPLKNLMQTAPGSRQPRKGYVLELEFQLQKVGLKFVLVFVNTPLISLQGEGREKGEGGREEERRGCRGSPVCTATLAPCRR